MLRALIVDEYRFFREIFRPRLLDHFPSMSIQEAIEKIKRMRPYLIFMDICLPGLNGLQLTQRIKQDFLNIGTYGGMRGRSREVSRLLDLRLTILGFKCRRS